MDNVTSAFFDGNSSTTQWSSIAADITTDTTTALTTTREPLPPFSTPTPTPTASESLPPLSTQMRTSWDGWANSTASPQGLVPPYWDHITTIILSVWLSPVILFSVVGNTMVLMVLLRNKGMRSKTNMFIANLAVADISVAVLDMPFSLATVIYGDWPFGYAFCQFNALTNVFFIIASLQTLMMISIHKYFAIVHPLKRIVTKRKAWLMMAIIWLMALACAIGPLVGWTSNTYKPGAVECGPELPETPLQKSHGIFIFSVGYVVPFAIMAFCYGRIFHTMHQHAQRLRIHSDWEEERIFRQQRRVAVTMFIVLVIFLICWTPYFTYATWAILQGPEAIPAIMNPIAYWAGFTNSGCNPVVYSFRNKAFRKGFKRLFRVSKKGFKRGFTFLGSGSAVDASPMARRRNLSTRSAIVDHSPGSTPQTGLRRQDTQTITIRASPQASARGGGSTKGAHPHPHRIVDPLAKRSTATAQQNGDLALGRMSPRNDSDRSLRSSDSSTASCHSQDRILPAVKGRGSPDRRGQGSREARPHRARSQDVTGSIKEANSLARHRSEPSSPVTPLDIALSIESIESQETQL